MKFVSIWNIDIFKTGELDENSVVKKILTTASDGNKYRNSNSKLLKIEIINPILIN